ncbi:sensor histidine kinase [Sphingobium fuliginis]|uniref:histidine kinase n=1 Tax=Sphingobium fuliginis ATCC 27551 TaxID=1208342 RepID=A0A5B8CHZ4_SPHSA|nr:histidine kinase [Sphingobium fuliginis]QDC36411.1 two-component sensor histidine kinase [Sphingobium fuliginis ATCC 27551]
MGDVRHAMNGPGEIAMRLSWWDMRALSALRPWQTLDFTRLLLAVIYAVVSFGFSSARHWAESAEHVLILLMLLLAFSAVLLSSRSWVTDMRIRRPVIYLDTLLFLALLVVTNPSNSPYFSGSFFVAVEVALIVRRRFHLLVALAAGTAAVGVTWLDEIASLPSEPEAERVVLRACYLAVAILVTGVLLGPRRETLLQFERDRRLLEGELPPAGSDHGPFLLHALRLATRGHGVAVLFRLASHEPLRFASSAAREMPAVGFGNLLTAETGWHDRSRHASISLSADGIAVLGPLSPGGQAWTALLDAETLLTVRVTIGTFEAVGAACLDDPCHEDRAAIAQRVFESACEELTVRNSLDLAHVIAGARERERLQRELHDSVLQALASIRFQIAPLLAGRQVEPLAVIENVDRIAKDQIATIRWIINPDVDEEDFAYLPETLAMVVRSLGEQWGIGCELKVEDGNCATSAMIGRELSFAVREIVANAVRHARATMVNFALEPDGNRIALQVSDDGVPNMARLGSSGAVPSRSLMRRIQMLGGEVFLQNIGGRTTIRITVPRK